jgi:hypothetical protein
MDNLRKPFFILALALIAIAVLIEIGAGGVLKSVPTPPAALGDQLPPDVSSAYNNLDSQQQAELTKLSNQDKPPGMGIPYLALLDGIALFTAALMGLGLVVPPAMVGRVQGCATLIFTVIIIITAIVMIIAAIALIMVMVALLLSIPFGTIVYMIIYGFFDRSGASAVLALLMVLKLGFAASLVAAQQRFLQNTGLVLIIITSLIGNVIISFLHGLVPKFLVSITDGIAAIVVAVLAVLWALFLFIGSLIAIVRIIQLGKVSVPGR